MHCFHRSSTIHTCITILHCPITLKFGRPYHRLKCIRAHRVDEASALCYRTPTTVATLLLTLQIQQSIVDIYYIRRPNFRQNTKSCKQYVSTFYTLKNRMLINPGEQHTMELFLYLQISLQICLKNAHTFHSDVIANGFSFLYVRLCGINAYKTYLSHDGTNHTTLDTLCETILIWKMLL